MSFLKNLAFFILLDIIVCAGGVGIGWSLGQQGHIQEAAPLVEIRPAVSMAVDNLSRLGEMTRTYYETHLYIRKKFDCSDMAPELWDMSAAAGFPAVILVGNPWEAGKQNHAWVAAEVEPGEWVALEGTNGNLYASKPYLKGMAFDDPRKFVEWRLRGAAPGRDLVLPPFTGNGSTWIREQTRSRGERQL